MDNYLAAIGGNARLASVQTACVAAWIRLGKELDHISWIWQRPGRFRVEMRASGRRVVQGYDGTVAWSFGDGAGDQTARRLSEDEFADLLRMTDFEGPLVSYQEKGTRIELVGVKNAGTADASFRLRLVPKTGPEQYLVFSASTYLPFMSVESGSGESGPRETTTWLGNYKDFDGITVPTLVRVANTALPGGELEIEFCTVETGVEVDPDAFRLPQDATVKSGVRCACAVPSVPQLPSNPPSMTGSVQVRLDFVKSLSGHLPAGFACWADAPEASVLVVLMPTSWNPDVWGASFLEKKRQDLSNLGFTTLVAASGSRRVSLPVRTRSDR